MSDSDRDAIDALAAARAEHDQVLAGDRDFAIRVAHYYAALRSEGLASDEALPLALYFQSHLLAEALFDPEE